MSIGVKIIFHDFLFVYYEKADAQKITEKTKTTKTKKTVK
jgi:hypothetical protein